MWPANNVTAGVATNYSFYQYFHFFKDFSGIVQDTDFEYKNYFSKRICRGEYLILFNSKPQKTKN